MARKSVTARRIHAALDTLDKKANVAGYIVMRGAMLVGTIRFSYPRDGAGRLRALAANWTATRPRNSAGEPDFEAWTPWQYGWANGCGYDKHTAALAGMTIAEVTIKDEGWGWAHQLHAAGLNVIHAV